MGRASRAAFLHLKISFFAIFSLFADAITDLRIFIIR